jgi:hypothetical protein
MEMYTFLSLHTANRISELLAYVEVHVIKGEKLIFNNLRNKYKRRQNKY